MCKPHGDAFYLARPGYCQSTGGSNPAPDWAGGLRRSRLGTRLWGTLLTEPVIQSLYLYL